MRLYPDESIIVTGNGWWLWQDENGECRLELQTRNGKIMVGLYVHQEKDRARREIAQHIIDSAKILGLR